MDDIGKQFNAFFTKAKATMNKFPVVAGNTAVNFFQDSFENEAFLGVIKKTWPKRKNDKEPGRKILTKTGNLKRAIRSEKQTWGLVHVSNNMPYAKKHNEGFKGTETVNEHSRIATRRVSTYFKKDGSAGKRNEKIKGRGYQVGSFARKVNMPQRQFMGNSPNLNRRIESEFIKLLKSI